MFQNHKSEILLATPLIKDDAIFTKSVIYLCQNDRHGAMGLIINKPLDDKLKDVFEELDIPHNNTFEEILNHPLYMGGPISPHKILILHTTNGRNYNSTIKLDEGLAITASMDILEDLANNILPEYFLPIVGYSCWTADQLSDEIKASDWIVTDKLSKKILFNYENKTKWQNHLEHAGYSLQNLDSLFENIGNG
ncbi:YqgE/AlgH family protein [Francisella sp. LA112445]|jgi:putative transcriptional regulator|uniref:YqgE/AlgH family protein n=1 Tax=Francisella sp. LA112445 TaxID=1395624 RepID=UPI001788B716|nr:YqgE/AlgH family protein [Francisella sp. LA112445]QIW10180.1 YqgE/AlgH family protein [Francisella sp. LA112445]